MGARGNKVVSQGKVNSGVSEKSSSDNQDDSPSTIGERLLFCTWLSAKVLGTESQREFARAIGKGGTQLSKWIAEDPRPSWDSIKAIADALGINAAWLDEPGRGGDVPRDFPEWLAARRRRQAELRRQVSEYL